MTTEIRNKVLTIVMLAQIAEICHETNRAYCETMGDYSQDAWDDAQEWQKESAKNGVKFHWATMEEGKEPTPHDSHNSWLAEKRAAGWTHGEKKDTVAKTHPCFVPYDELPAAQRLKDYLFVNVVKAFFFAQ